MNKVITLTLPPSINATYKSGNGVFYKSAKAREWFKISGYEANIPRF